MKANLISEFEHLPKAHGIHTAYTNVVQLLKSRGVTVDKNAFFDTHDITHVHSVGPFALFKLLTSKHTIITAHVIPDSLVGGLIGIKYWYGLAQFYFRFIFNHADLVIAVGKLEVEQLKKLGVKKEIVMMPNPINETYFHEAKSLKEEGRKRLGMSEKEFIVMGCGQVIPRKGIADFIKTAKLLPHMQFVWVGTIPLKTFSASDSELDSLLSNLPKNVTMAGNIGSYKDVPFYYNAADVFLFPSYQETAGMVVVEAGLCGLPLVLRDLPEYRKLYKENYLCANTPEGFTNIIEKLSKNKEFYEKTKKEGKLLGSQYTFASIGDRLLAIYGKVSGVAL